MWKIKPEPLVPKSVIVYEHLKRQILSGELPSQSPISLNALADELGISHVPAREAIRLLQADGLVEHKPNKGARVSQFTDNAYCDVLESLAILEGAALALGYRNLTKAQLDQASELNEKMRAFSLSESSPDAHWQQNREFHRLLISGCTNHIIHRQIEVLQDILSSSRSNKPLFDEDRMREATKEHDQILLAIANDRDSEEIERVSRDHRKRSRPH